VDERGLTAPLFRTTTQETGCRDLTPASRRVGSISVQAACQPKWLATLEGEEAMREIITLQCPVCKNRNYSTTKNKKTTTGRLEFSKFCNTCRKHTDHKETK
jgi:large subunit ribosomal protein L33